MNIYKINPLSHLVKRISKFYFKYVNWNLNKPIELKSMQIFAEQKKGRNYNLILSF
jgi:hypothetical protein